MSLRFETGFDEAQGRRETMEDTHVVIERHTSESAKQYDNLAFFGVYDGHGGVDAAVMVQQNLHENIFNSDRFKAGDVVGAIAYGFETTDEHIIKTSNEKGWMNGSTAVVGLICNKKLYAANIGDSEAILVRENDGELETSPLTVPHKASDPKEKERIEKLGGHVFFGRVFGALAVSRSFGDSKFKIPKTTQNFVSWEPATLTLDLNPATDRFIIFACDGLWDVMSHKEAGSFVAKHRKEGQTASEIAKLLVREALIKKTEDNVTVVIVFLLWGEAKNENEQKETTTAEVAIVHVDANHNKENTTTPENEHKVEQHDTLINNVELKKEDAINEHKHEGTIEHKHEGTIEHKHEGTIEHKHEAIEHKHEGINDQKNESSSEHKNESIEHKDVQPHTDPMQTDGN